MDAYKIWIDLAVATYLIFLATMMQTQNMRSSFLFRFLPGLGAALLLLANGKVLFG